MQEEIIQTTLAIIMRAEQIGEQQMRQAFQKVLTDLEQGRRKMPGTDRTGHHGKRSLRELQSGGAQLTNVEITDDNMKSFEKYAREYGIDYSLKVNRLTDPPHWYIFFRA